MAEDQMTVTPMAATEGLLIVGAKGLDPIRVFLPVPERQGCCRIVIVCWDRAWSGFWGAIGSDTPVGFLTRCNAEYIAGNLLCGAGLSRGKHHEAYLVRIVEAVQAALRRVHQS